MDLLDGGKVGLADGEDVGGLLAVSKVTIGGVEAFTRKRFGVRPNVLDFSLRCVCGETVSGSRDVPQTGKAEVSTTCPSCGESIRLIVERPTS